MDLLTTLLSLTHLFASRMVLVELFPSVHVERAVFLVNWQCDKIWQENWLQFLCVISALCWCLDNGMMAHASGVRSKNHLQPDWDQQWALLAQFPCSVDLAKTMEKSFRRRRVEFLCLEQPQIFQYSMVLYAACTLDKHSAKSGQKVGKK